MLHSFLSMTYLEKDYDEGGKGLMQILAVTHTGMTKEVFAESVKKFFESARHGKATFEVFA